MIEQRLVDYIKTNLSKGFSLEQVKKKLLASGWPEYDVNEAINLSQQETSSPTIKPTTKTSKPVNSPIKKPVKKSSKTLWVVLIIIIVLIGGGIFAFFTFREAGTESKPSIEKPIPTAAGETGAVDCGTDLDCFIQASQNCDLAKVTHTATFNIFGMEQTTISSFELKGIESDKCIFYLKTESVDVKYADELVQQMLTSGSTEEQIQEQEQEANERADTSEGLDRTCKFNKDDLTSMLNKWKIGTFSTEDWDVAECEDGMV